MLRKPDGKTYVKLDETSTWTLTGDSEISALTCSEDAIKLNGYTLKVNGKEYKEGTASNGKKIEFEVPKGGGGDGQPPEMPKDGNGEPPKAENGQPPEKPNGETGQPPENQVSKDEGLNNSNANLTRK